MNNGDLSLQRFWNQILESMDNRSDVISAQLAQAQDLFPELSAAFNLFVAYVGYLHQELGDVSGDSFVFYPLPEQFCRHNPIICDCVNGSEDACKLLGGPLLDEIKEEPADCDSLWQKYREAKQRELDELINALKNAGSPPVVAEEPGLSLHLYKQKESERIYQELKKSGCILPRRPIA